MTSKVQLSCRLMTPSLKICKGQSWPRLLGHRVVVKPFPGATIHDMKSHIIPTIEKSPDQICLHIGTNDLKSKEPNMVADAIVDLASEIENSCDAEIVLSDNEQLGMMLTAMR